MAIPKGVHVDRLILGQLRFPLLNEYYGSPAQKDDVGEIAREIQRRYLAAVPKRTGKLASTARITYHRTKVHPDRRWEAEFSIGGPAAPYVVQVEAEQHILANVLREMGFFVGDRVDGPEGTIARPHREPPDRRPVYQTTEVEQRKERARAQREFAARADDSAAGERRAENELAQERGEVDAMIADLGRRRHGSKAEKDAYANLNRARFFSDDPNVSANAAQALEAHRAGRAKRGLDPRPAGAPVAPDEKVATTTRSVDEINAASRARQDADERERARQATAARVREAGYEVGQTIRVRDPGDGEPIEATVKDVRSGRGAFGVMAELEGETMEFSREELLD